MTFANPFAWGLLLLAVPIVLFFFLRVRFRKELVTTSFFWQQVFEERRTRRLRRRFRHFLSLLCALLFLTLLTAAVLNPIFFASNSQRCVIVIDTSASMNALVPGSETTRLEVAKQQAKELLNRFTADQEIAVITASALPKNVSGFTDVRRSLQQKLSEISPTDSPADIGAALNLAKQLVADQADAQIFFYTDSDFSKETAETKNQVRWIPMGQSMDNLAITRFQPRRLPEHASDYEILIEAVNFSADSMDTRLEIELDGEIVDVIPLTLEPNKPTTKVLRHVSSAGGLLRATLLSNDSFSTDNVSWAVLSEQFVQRVFLYGTDNFYLRQVLQSLPQTEVIPVENVPDSLPPECVLVCHQTVPPTLPVGNVLVIDPQNSCDLFQVGERLEKPIAANVDTENPLVRFSQFSGLIFTGARQLTVRQNNVTENNMQVLVETADSFPLYLQFASENRKTLVFSAELSQGDIALRTTFPIFVSQALSYFRNSEEMQKVYSTGEWVKINFQTESERIILRSPSGKERTIPCQSGLAIPGRLEESGVWTVHEPISDRELGKIACNLFSASESDLRFAAEKSVLLEDAASSSLLASPIWYYLAFLALCFTILEWFLYQRRWVE